MRRHRRKPDRSSARSLFDRPCWIALRNSILAFKVRNPVMFVVFVGSVFTSPLFTRALFGAGEAQTWFILTHLAVALVPTCSFANFSEAVLKERKGQSRFAPQIGTELTAKRFGTCHLLGETIWRRLRHQRQTGRGLQSRSSQSAEEGDIVR